MTVLSTVVHSQPNWSVSATSGYSIVKVPGNLVLAESLLGDVYIGAFHSHSGEFKCGGYGEFEAGTDLYFPIYQLEDQTDGFILGEKIDIIIYGEGNECQHFYNVSFASSGNIFNVSDTFEIANATPSALINIDYSVISKCQSEGIIVPNITVPYFPTGTLDLHFESDDNLVINNATGEILPGQSEVGNYIIEVESEYCLIQNSFNMEIREFPMDEIVTKDISICEGSSYLVQETQLSGNLLLTPLSTTPGFNLDSEGVYYYQMNYVPTGCPGFTAYNLSLISSLVSSAEIDVKPKTCFSNGSIHLNPNSINGTTIVNYILDGDSVEFPDIYDVDVGVHELSIIDDIGCLHLLSDDINVETDFSKCKKEDIVFYPNHHQFSNGYLYFSETGPIKIVGENGKLINEFEGPLEWNGKDINGNGLKSGIYFIIYEGDIIQNLTIVR